MCLCCLRERIVINAVRVGRFLPCDFASSVSLEVGKGFLSFHHRQAQIWHLPAVQIAMRLLLFMKPGRYCLVLLPAKEADIDLMCSAIRWRSPKSWLVCNPLSVAFLFLSSSAPEQDET